MWSGGYVLNVPSCAGDIVAGVEAAGTAMPSCASFTAFRKAKGSAMLANRSFVPPVPLTTIEP
jgi:hypothetical protein